MDFTQILNFLDQAGVLVLVAGTAYYFYQEAKATKIAYKDLQDKFITLSAKVAKLEGQHEILNDVMTKIEKLTPKT